MSQVDSVRRGSDILMLHVCHADDLCKLISFSHSISPLLRLIENILAECGYSAMRSAFVELLSFDINLLAIVQWLTFRHIQKERNHAASS